MNWEAAARRDAMRAAREPRPVSRRGPKPPTQKQLRLLTDLSREIGIPVPTVWSLSEAATAIDRLLKRKQPTRVPVAPPTSKQMRYLRRLAESLGVAVPKVRTLPEARRAIADLVSQTAPTRRQLREIQALAAEIGVRVPPATTRADAERDLELFLGWREDRSAA